MPVVINEFEVVPDTSPPPENKAGGNQSEAAKPKEPADLDKFIRWQSERAQRVRAH